MMFTCKLCITVTIVTKSEEDSEMDDTKSS